MRHPKPALFVSLVLCIAVTGLRADETALGKRAGADKKADKKTDGWVELFDGETLKGFRQLGGKAKYHVEDGAIVGTTVLKTPNSFLATEKLYADFELELEYLVDPHMNSGVQIRSEVRPNGRVFGYQVEIDPSDRAWSGGIYDEARRGWVNDLKDKLEARKAFRQNEWNHYRVVCIGDWIRTWINGVPAADLRDSETLEGFIALQVHSYNPAKHPEKKPDLQVRWRNIRLRPLGRHVWKSIWDGETLEGWDPVGGGKWTIEDGQIVGRQVKSDAAHGHLFWKQPVGDFTVRIEYKPVSGNSGLYFRTEKIAGAVGIRGFQAEIDAEKDPGGLYETSGRAWVAKPSAAAIKKFKPRDWNRMSVSAHGRRIAVHVGGIRSAELRDDPGRLEGLLAFQVHGGQDMEVRIRKVEMLVPEKPAKEPTKD